MASGSVAPNPKLPQTHFRIPRQVAWRAFPTETVLLNLNTGRYHGLNPTGGRMFEVLGECGDLRISARQLADEFQQPLETVTADLRELCVGLVERGLLETTAG